MPIQPQQNYNNIYPKLLFQSYQKNAIGGKFNIQGGPIMNGPAHINIARVIRIVTNESSTINF